MNPTEKQKKVISNIRNLPLRRETKEQIIAQYRKDRSHFNDETVVLLRKRKETQAQAEVPLYTARKFMVDLTAGALLGLLLFVLMQLLLSW